MGRTEIVEPIDIVSGDYIFSLFLSFVAIITNYNFREGASAGVGFWKHETSAACVCVKRERERESVCVCPGPLRSSSPLRRHQSQSQRKPDASLLDFPPETIGRALRPIGL